MVKILASAGAIRDMSSFPALGRSPGEEGRGSHSSCSYLENSWQLQYIVTQSWRQMEQLGTYETAHSSTVKNKLTTYL